MEQDVDNNFKIICSTCLCGDRKLFALNNTQEVYQIFRLLMFDFAGEAVSNVFFKKKKKHWLRLSCSLYVVIRYVRCSVFYQLYLYPRGNVDRNDRNLYF